MITRSQIDIFAAKVANQYHPEAVILFGSQADGTSTSDSDVDLLVVLDHNEKKNVAKAVEILNALDPAFPIDLLVRRPADVDREIESGDPILRAIFNEGITLYARGNS